MKWVFHFAHFFVHQCAPKYEVYTPIIIQANIIMLSNNNADNGINKQLTTTMRHLTLNGHTKNQPLELLY